MSEAAPIRRIVMPDPSLISMAGHHYNYTRAVAEAARKRGLEAVVLGHKTAQEQVLKEVPAIPFFQVATYAELPVEPDAPDQPLDPATLRARQLLRLNRYTLAELSQLSGALGPQDLVFFHTVSMTQILAITEWLMGFEPDRLPQTRILLRFFPERPHEIPLLQLCGAVLADPRLRCRFCTDTAELSALNSNVVRAPVDVVPIPHAPHRRAPGEPARRFVPALAPGTAVVGYLGHATVGRGFLLRSKIVESIAADAPRPFHFLMQIGAADPSAEAMEEARRLLALAGPRLTVVMETLSREDYYDFLERCDIVVIAYSPHEYRYGSSGVFTEAASAGKVTIVPAGTSMAREARRFGAGCVPFAEFTAPSIAGALRAALADLPALAERARAAAAGMLAYHNADNLVAYLLGETVAG